MKFPLRGIGVGIVDEEGGPTDGLKTQGVGVEIGSHTHVEKQEVVAQASAMERPKPVAAFFRGKVGGPAVMKRGVELESGVRRIVAGLDGYAVAKECGLTASGVWLLGDEGVAEEPQNAGIAEIDGEGGVAAEPKRVGVEELVGLRPGHGVNLWGDSRQWFGRGRKGCVEWKRKKKTSADQSGEHGHDAARRHGHGKEAPRAVVRKDLKVDKQVLGTFV